MSEKEFLLRAYLTDAAYAATVGNRDLLVMCIQNAKAIYRGIKKCRR